jgi:hypothetical protein
MSITRKRVSNLVGIKVGRLEVTAYAGKGKYDKHYWSCLCECGNIAMVNTSRLTGAKQVLSCGCLRKEKLLANRRAPTKHGLHRHKLYGVHGSMKQRCTNPNSQRWQYYGGKGVSVCKEWQNFLTFYEWAIANGYQEGLSIDRIDPEGNYQPDNCHWITVAENTRKSNVRDPRAKVQEDSCHP